MAVQHSHEALTATFATQLDQLKATYSTGIEELRATYSASLAAQQSRRPRPCLPDLPLLTGPAEFDVWLPLLEGKIRVDGEAIGSPEAIFMYVYGRLDWKVQQIVRPQLSASKPDTWDFTTITNALSRIYEDPNKIIRASRKLRALKMKDEDSIRSFLTLWEKNSWDAGTFTLTDTLRIQDLRAAISPRLQAKIDDREAIPDKYDDFVQLLLRLGGGYGQGYRSGHQNTGGTGGTTPMDISTIEISSIHPVKASQDLQDPRDLQEDLQDSSNVPIKSLWTENGQSATDSTWEVRNKRRERHQCLRCGNPSHHVRDCPLLLAREYVKFHDESD